ncbi:autotransporter assembly complex protein TamA [Psychrobacter aestuarii]|uniref:Autotransporter assembly complex family protein n=1 Tax=Psychrobacter aestuarii TaxID=556327 RepID=A0ABP3FPS4_9GAMM|nr:BamA/TamA family outer membrane protein [Psychrobacter aestuarii]
MSCQPSRIEDTYRHHAARTALFTALAGCIAGFGVSSAQAAPASAYNDNTGVDAQLDAALRALEPKIPTTNTAPNTNTTTRPVSRQNSRLPRNTDDYQMRSPREIEAALAQARLERTTSSAPVATLNDNRTPIGFDASLDAANLPMPTNLETLGVDEDNIGDVPNVPELPSRAATSTDSRISTRPINVSDSVSSQGQPSRSGQSIDDIRDNLDTTVQDGERAAGINPDDYLPDYQADSAADTVSNSIEDSAESSERSSGGNIFKRTYNRLFNGGAIALPHVESTVYLQQTSADGSSRLVKADKDSQPINNIKAALDDTTVQSVVDFTAALPRLRQTALDAARAVGYYDVALRLRQPSNDRIDVIIESLGEPVRVDSQLIDIRGEGSEQKEYQVLEENLPPKEGDIFNHRVYKNSKAALESLSRTYGYFDERWLNKSVDIILPDNTADVSLIYDTGVRYDFDDVVFFTYDSDTGTLTTDPDKLPVEPKLLRQLLGFNAGDPFYQPDITKLSNDLSATRYFNLVNVESILPPDEQTEGSTLAFDNTANPNSDPDNAVMAAGIGDGNVTTSSAARAGIADSKSSLRFDNQSSDTLSDADRVAPEDIAPINFEVDEKTTEKLQAIKQKAERLSRLPDDRVLDEKPLEAQNLLGKISDTISNVAQKVFPDDKVIIDEDFEPPTLAGRKTPEEVYAQKKVPLYVFVSAEEPRDAQVGIGYGTDTGVRATAKIDYNLINRKGYQAGAEVAVSRINKNATVYASRPWNHPLNDKIDGRLTYEEELIDQGEGNFDLSTKTLRARLARNIRNEEGWNRSYFVRYRSDELETGVDMANLQDLPVRFTSSNPTQQALLLGYGVSKTKADSTTNPTRGYRQYYSIEAGSESALSDTDMAIINAGVSGVYSFGEENKHQLIGQLNGGYIWADDFYDVPYKLRFFAGGDQSIRGYDYNSLSPIEKGYLTGGQILAVGSAEYNYAFKPGLRGAIFTDVGNAYDKDFDADTKVGVGVGVRWASPVGIVRVDVAAGVTEEEIPVRLHFFIGSPL